MGALDTENSVDDISSADLSSDSSFSNDLPKRSKIDQIKIMNVNCQSIKSTLEKKELELLIYEHKPDIVFGTESHLDSDYKDAEIFPPGYVPLRHDRNRNGGGVFIAYRDDLSISQISNFGRNSESLLAKLRSSGRPDLYLCVMYRPPDSDLEPLIELESDLASVFQSNKQPNIIMAGDFNLPSVNWSQDNMISDKPCYSRVVNEKMVEIISNNYLCQSVC